MSIAVSRLTLASAPALQPTSAAAGPNGGKAAGSANAERGLQLILVGVAGASLVFLASVLRIASADPGYFDRLILAAERGRLDPVVTGSVAKKEAETNDAMPVPEVVRERPLTPSDFQIVMVFGEEALLATRDELWRVKVGSVLPALGTILAIEPAAMGGTVRTSEAILTSIAE